MEPRILADEELDTIMREKVDYKASPYWWRNIAREYAKAQAALTLKEVGEWLKSIGYQRFDARVRAGIDALLRGEMPEGQQKGPDDQT